MKHSAVWKSILILAISLNVNFGHADQKSLSPRVAQEKYLQVWADTLNSFSNFGELFNFYQQIGLMTSDEAREVKSLVEKRHVPLGTKLPNFHVSGETLYCGKIGWMSTKDFGYKTDRGAIVKLKGMSSATRIFEKALVAYSPSAGFSLLELVIGSEARAAADDSDLVGAVAAMAGDFGLRTLGTVGAAGLFVTAGYAESLMQGYQYLKNLLKAPVTCEDGNYFFESPEKIWQPGDHAENFEAAVVSCQRLRSGAAPNQFLATHWENLCAIAHAGSGFLESTVFATPNKVKLSPGRVNKYLGSETSVCSAGNIEKIKTEIAKEFGPNFVEPRKMRELTEPSVTR